MQSAQLVAPRTWELIDTEKPQAGPGTMLVRLERVAICGSDKSSYCGIEPNYPLPPGRSGHEGLGIVEACPSGAFAVGQRVLLWGFDRGLFQEYVLTNDSSNGCIALPHTMPEETILMSQLLGTVIHAFYKLGNVINQQAVVIGQGSVGQLFNLVLRNLGARTIIGVDPLDYRLDIAKRMGATHVVNPEKTNLTEAVSQITGGDLADLVIEAVGETASWNQVPGVARRNGQVICFGVPDKENHTGRIEMPSLDFLRKELRLIHSIGPNPLQDYTIARDWITQGRLDVTPIISHILPFAQIQSGFEMAFDHPVQHKACKIILKF